MGLTLFVHFTPPRGSMASFSKGRNTESMQILFTDSLMQWMKAQRAASNRLARDLQKDLENLDVWVALGRGTLIGPGFGGVFAGATTNTPSLAAAQAAIQSVPGSNPASGDFLGRAYAVAYPFGIIGIILTMLLVRRIFSIDVDAEARRAALSTGASERAPDFIDLQVSNPKWMVSPSEICLLPRNQVSSSHNGKVTVPEDDALIQIDDGLRLVGPRAKLLEFEPSSASR